MNKHHSFMLQAIIAAKAAQADGGVAIGAVLVDDASGNVVATGGSTVGVTHDPTSHAEIVCIRAAAHKLSSDDLYGHTLYSTLEPCHMCLSAAAWAKIGHVYFGAYRKDVDPTLFDTFHERGDEAEAAHMNLRERTHMHVQGGVLEAECAQLLDGYHEKVRHN
jgi:tRNA(Arg) A34 adenosine deaminase TadA